MSHCFKTCDPGGPTANLGASWSYPWRTGLWSLPRVRGDGLWTETHPTGQSFVCAGSASLPSPHAARPRAGNMETAQVQGGLWAEQAPSHPRALLPQASGFHQHRIRLHLRNRKHFLLSGCYTHKTDRGLNPEYLVLLFKTQLTGAAG